MVMQSLIYGNQRISYQVLTASRRKSRVSIHVNPDGSVQVNVPVGVDPELVRQAVQKRAKWIVGNLEKIRLQQENILPRNYVSGESYFYLGRRYVLKVFSNGQSADQVRLIRGRFEVSAQNQTPERVKALLWQWYREHARDYFSQQLEGLTSQVPWVRECPQWRLRKMTRRWGSCSPRGVLCLNPHLVKAPKECVEYVLLHELCHIKEHNHSKRFYHLLDRHMPNWRSLKAKLDAMAAALLNE